jgi:hypothetical protein
MIALIDLPNLLTMQIGDEEHAALKLSAAA